MSPALPWMVLLLLLPGCVRARRVFAPEAFVTPAAPTGEQAVVVVSTGWADEPPMPYDATEAFEHGGDSWLEPVPVTDRGWVEIHPLRPDATVRVMTRPTGWRNDVFHPVVALSGTLRGELDTAVRFVPSGPLGEEPLRLHVADLQNVYAGARLEDGDLLLVEVGAPGTEPERYLFRARRFGWRTRPGAGVLLRLPLPIEDQQDVGLSPALTLSLAVGYRPRTRSRLLEFPLERLALVASVGVGSTAVTGTGPLEDQLQGAFNAALLGGGVEVFEVASIQILGNASAPLRDDVEAGWTLAVGVDAVQLGRAVGGAVTRLLSEHPLEEDRGDRR